MRVLLIDDHALFRIGLLELLERRGIEVIDAVGDSDVGLRLARDCAPDVVLMDLRMPGENGIDVVRRMQREGIERRVAMLTTSTDERDVVEALQAGVNGYLLKDMEPDDLVAALQGILNGQTIVAPELTGALARAVRQETAAPDEPAVTFSDLTPREMEILCHLAGGQSNKVIGNELGISEGTVKLHVKSILRKLKMRSRVEAAVLAVEQGLCDRQ
ncbi:two-component system response regulator NarL [Lamprobacter modestohalophilus]|uniref:Two-component system response regulator NarL n=1 Tax=Lamprobacter modestohalophilus TaxID=1064514 RepID=A0A9X0W6N1_9GAMM|nr:response regulator transcription factor [Lamprobacter modestohalophilus]MBK1617809.1 two-component system response regulator NarL [Lamprobacter modestohalophilus]MCF7978225.1 response regulator transcription factor [Chromatiaceae bacterium]